MVDATHVTNGDPTQSPIAETSGCLAHGRLRVTCRALKFGVCLFHKGRKYIDDAGTLPTHQLEVASEGINESANYTIIQLYRPDKGWGGGQVE